MTRTLLFGVATTMLLGGSALAADIPRKAPPPAVAAIHNWAGLYIGVQGGGGWGKHDRLNDTGFANSYNSRGGLVGGHGGYNWQFNQLVLGIEVDGAWANIKGDDAGAGGTIDETRARALASARGRIGLAFNRFLVFGTGGWGWARLDHANFSAIPVKTSHNGNGWTAGGGVQYAVTDNWSIGVEYRHYDLGDYRVVPTNLTAFNVDNKINTVTGRITYKFGAPQR